MNQINNSNTSGKSYDYNIYKDYTGQAVNTFPQYKKIIQYNNTCENGSISDPVPVSINPLCFLNYKPHHYIEPKINKNFNEDNYNIFNSSPYKHLNQINNNNNSCWF